MAAVRCYVDKTQTHWDRYLPQIAGAIRATVNRSTGFTPNKLMFGREVNQPTDLVFPLPSSQERKLPSEFCMELSHATQTAHDVARRNLHSTQRRMKSDYDVRIKTTEYAENDWVYFLDHATPKGKTKKLCPPWKGPAQITKCLSPYLFRIRYRNTFFVINHDRIKKCKDRTLPDAPGTQLNNDVYCICRKPDDGRLMVQCDRCGDWFHGACVNILPADALAIRIYICPLCRTPRGINH